MMLVLTRRVGEKIQVSDDVTVTVMRSESGYISLGVTAPKDIPVHREEIYKALQREKDKKE